MSAAELPPLPSDIARLLKQAEKQDAAQAASGQAPIEREVIYRMANFGLGLMDEASNPVLFFDTPGAAGLHRHTFPFVWDAFKKYVDNLNRFLEENKPAE